MTEDGYETNRITITPEPTAEHIDAVARALNPVAFAPAHRFPSISTEAAQHDARRHSEDLLTSTDPDVHAALAANLPTDVMRPRGSTPTTATGTSSRTHGPASTRPTRLGTPGTTATRTPPEGYDYGGEDPPDTQGDAPEWTI